MFDSFGLASRRAQSAPSLRLWGSSFLLGRMRRGLGASRTEALGGPWLRTELPWVSGLVSGCPVVSALVCGGMGVAAE
ncbi:hypothetical protein GCM10010343_14680 [Streptomyces avidinii]|nr:hypothetical protein GCM10010343_14680 [Streptomyces avidinii]